ncbi:MAG: DUF4912 domain-containing protein [Verrucomicrobiota bacterium]
MSKTETSKTKKLSISEPVIPVVTKASSGGKKSAAKAVPKTEVASPPKATGKTTAVKAPSVAAEGFVAKAAKRIVEATKKLKAAVQEAKPAAQKIRKTIRKTALEIPQILMEGDTAPAPAQSGPGQRYSLGSTPPEEKFSSEGELPEAYGTQKLLLTARDPHWLYAHWDFTHAQLRQHNALSVDGHLVLRLYKNESEPEAQIHVHPESRHWFIPAEEAGAKYFVELGYYTGDGDWTQLSISGSTMTPPDALSEDVTVQFATIPVDVPFEELIRMVKAAVRENIPLAEAIMQLGAEGFKNLPATGSFAAAPWTAEQERALGELITMDSVRRVWIGSLEITELIRRQLTQEISSAVAAQFSLPSSISVSSLSSPFGGGEKRKGFWFNINAELIIYGATEPDAKVEIGGRKIQLRPDGTFSFRFILPDGNYDLPAQATSADGDDTRSAHLKFSRKTNYSGEVGAHPQDSRMKKPEVANVG